MFGTTVIFMVLAGALIIFTVVLSSYAKFNPAGPQNGPYVREFVYSVYETHELLTNTCKLPYIFLTDDKVSEGNDNSTRNCGLNELNDRFSLSPDGVLTMRSEKEIESTSVNSIRCTYYKHSGVSNQSFEIEEDKPVKVPFYNLAVTCKKERIVEFVKPLVNFAMLPKNDLGEAVSVLYLPAMHHKLFMTTMRHSKKLMIEQKFLFAKMMTMKEQKPLQDFLLQLGLSSDISTFQRAKQKNFATYFAGPQQIRDMIDVDYDSVAHRNFVFQFLIDEKMCMEDGRKYSDDQLDRFRGFLASTNGSKYFSVMLLDDYTGKKQQIDGELSEALRSLEEHGVFKNTTLIVASYDLADKEVSEEDAKNPLFAVRLSDNLAKIYPERHAFLTMNFNRLITSSHANHLILSLLDPNDTLPLSPVVNVLSTTSSCREYGISENMCLCMKSSPSSTYSGPLETKFLAEVKQKFYEEVKQSACARNVTIEDQPVFYEYSSKEKGDVRVVELSGAVGIDGPNGNRRLPLRKTFIFEPMFKTVRSFDSVRIIINYGVNTGIDRLCYL